MLELSSYQIDLTQSLDCDVAVLLNITPDHLDRYESFEAYRQSKLRLFTLQSPGHTTVYDFDGAEAAEIKAIRLNRDDTLWFDEHIVDAVTSWSDLPNLSGPHNRRNASAAITVCQDLNIPVPAGALETFSGLSHRMERIREKDGVLFVNDSKATNPTATAPALAAFDRIRWICGGQAKTDNLDECAPHFGHVHKAYTIGEAGDLFARLLSPHMDVAECETLERAVWEAAGDAEAGDTVLLSPACASFDQFRDFEQRGDTFRELVGTL